MSHKTPDEKQVKLDVNLAGAKIAYPSASLIEVDFHGEKVEVMVDGVYVATDFDIFPDTPKGAYCAKKVVIALGEKHGVYIGIIHTYLSNNGMHWYVTHESGSVIIIEYKNKFDTYIDALSSAIQVIGDK